MTKVIRIIPTIDRKLGGPSVSAVNAAIAESDRNVATTVATTVDGGSPEALGRAPARLEQSGVKLLCFARLGLLGRRGGTWGLSPRMTYWILRNVSRFDVVHLHYVWSLPTLIGAIQAARLGIPVVLTGHESLTRYDIDVTSGSRVKRRMKLMFRRVLMKRVSVVVCASDLELRDSLEDGEAGLVIHHPVSTGSPSAPPRVPKGDFVLGYLGRLHPKKGLERLLRAFAALDDPSARLIVCGEGPREYATRLQRLASELDIEARVEWRGHVDEAGRQGLFESIHFLAMPSDYECFGMAGAEALAAGIPIIVSSETGISSRVEEFACGYVFDVGSEDELVSALRRAASLDLASGATLRDNALGASDECFSFEAYRLAIKQVYSKLSDDADAHAAGRPARRPA